MLLLFFLNSPSAPSVSVQLRSIVEYGAGGSFRDLLMEQQNVVMTLPLSELMSTQAKDIAFGRNTGTYLGGTEVRGTPLGLPEGGLGTTFDGVSYVQVPDDGNGFLLLNDTGARTLSLAGGSMDIVFLFKTSTSDATLRAIVQKQETDSAGNGWHVALQNGFIEFYLKVGGAVIFSFQRGAIADGLWHLIQCHYKPDSNLARIIIDGVNSGADATGSTDPAITTANLRVGLFNNGAGGLIGAVGYLMVGRNGDATLSANLQPSRSWTDISADLHSGAIEATHGASGRNPLTRVSLPATLNLELLNFAQGARPVRYYTPGDANCRGGWEERVPIRWTVTDDVSMTKVRFLGFVDAIVPTTGQYRGRTVSVTATSWFGTVMSTPVQSIPVQISARSDVVFKRVIDEASRPPSAVSIWTGVNTFAFALDDIRGKPWLHVLARVVQSEWGRAYETADGTVVFRSVESELGDYLPDDTFTDTELRDLDAARDVGDVFNQVHLTMTPRVSSGSTVVLASMQSRIQIEPGATVHIDLPYRDPAQTAARVGGTSIVTPAATTDYTMTANADGTGTDLTSSAGVITTTETKGGGATSLQVTNNGTVTAFFKSQVRGVPLYTYDAVDLRIADDVSVRRYDLRELRIDVGYQSDSAQANATARQLLTAYSTPTMTPDGAVIPGSAANLSRLANRDIGDLVAVTETMSGLSGNLFMIVGTRLTATRRNFFMGEYQLLNSLSGHFWILGQAGRSELGETTVLA